LVKVIIEIGKIDNWKIDNWNW